jgi:hypothetical protein
MQMASRLSSKDVWSGIGGACITLLALGLIAYSASPNGDLGLKLRAPANIPCIPSSNNTMPDNHPKPWLKIIADQAISIATRFAA